MTDLLSRIAASALTHGGKNALRALLAHGTITGAGDALGLSRSAIQHRLRAARKVDAELVAVVFDDKVKAARQGSAPAFGLKHPVPDGLTLRGTSICYDGDGGVERYWNKTKPEGRDPADVVKIAGAKVIRTATNYDQEGRVTSQWVTEKAEDAQREQLWQEAAKTFAEALPAEAPVPTPECSTSDLIAVYPVGDHHFGMYAWGAETGGASHDLAKGEALLRDATQHLVNAAPACEDAAILILGDFLHADGFAPVTPTSRHVLDADSRYPKVVKVAIRSIRFLIKTALKKHKRVRLVIEIGNHDMSSAVFLMECFANLYEDEPRVIVDNSPRRFHCFTFGLNMIGTHHGDGVKMANLPLVFATDYPAEWGATRFRYLHTGHVHHDSLKDLPGATVESHRILPPADAYAANNGYRAPQGMKAIIYHRQFGEMARHSCNPQMLERAAA